eukprot:scaffold38939_cov191-Amphora_coffeaeformis.AAC.1
MVNNDDDDEGEERLDLWFFFLLLLVVVVDVVFTYVAAVHKHPRNSVLRVRTLGRSRACVAWHMF